MNGTFFSNPHFSDSTEKNELERRNDYNILKDNISKKVKVYTTFNDNTEKISKIFSGILELYKDDSLIISDPSTGNWYFIPIKYLNYIEFEEKIYL